MVDAFALEKLVDYYSKNNLIYCNFQIGFNAILTIFAYVCAVLMKSEKLERRQTETLDSSLLIRKIKFFHVKNAQI